MWFSILWHVLRQYGKKITIPIAAGISVLGYGLESLISDKYTPSIDSVQEQRDKRLLQEDQEVAPLKEKKFIPKTIFEKNLPPSLQEPDRRKEKYDTKHNL